MEVRFLQTAEVYPLRLLVLRPGGVLKDVDFAGDRNEGAFHLGVEHNAEIICVGSFYPEKQKGLKGSKQFRLRGMATHPDHRSQGVGEKLVRFGMEHLLTLNVELLWCNARRKAVPFYEHMGMEPQGEEFEIEGIGMHYLMWRKLP